MFKLNGNIISMVNKDTASIQVDITDYVFATGDKAYFTVKKSVTDNVNLIHKEVTEFNGNSVTFNLTSEDTDLEEGTYKYDVQLSLADGRVDTVIGPASFMIIKGVTDEV